MVKNKYFGLLAIVVFSLMVFSANAQIKLKKSVFGSAGNPSTGNNVKLNGTLGQSFIGMQKSSMYFAKVGFWNNSSGQATAIQEYDLGIGLSDDSFFKAYPNPFSNVLNLSFKLDEKKYVSLKIYDTSGRLVSIVVEGELLNDTYNFQFHSGNMPNGMYYCRLVANDQLVSKKISLIR